MIYVSSACVRNGKIGESVQQLAELGYTHIELSGGTQPYAELEDDLLQLQKEYSLHYLCHNYFPPPPVSFVVNLASLDDQIYEMSLEHLQRAIRLSEKLGATRFGFHAGFLINIPLHQIGKSIDSKELFNREEAKKRFTEGFKKLQESTQLKLYIENNVVSNTNFQNFGQVDPFLMTNHQDILEHLDRIDFNLILDVAHLKVSARTLNKSFAQELQQLLPLSDYIHISDNDGLHDSNNEFGSESELFHLMKGHSYQNKIFTIEVYDGLEAIKNSYNAAKELLQ